MCPSGSARAQVRHCWSVWLVLFFSFRCFLLRCLVDNFTCVDLFVRVLAPCWGHIRLCLGRCVTSVREAYSRLTGLHILNQSLGSTSADRNSTIASALIQYCLVLSSCRATRSDWPLHSHPNMQHALGFFSLVRRLSYLTHSTPLQPSTVNRPSHHHG